MEPLRELTSTVAPLLRDNVDTDTIIPAAYMRSLATDPGTGLFARWRYAPDGSPAAGFVLNDERYRSARILLTGANFGCGSSRENAVWALARFGFRCVIALGFSDIFRENAYKNAVLPVTLPAAEHAALAATATQRVLTLTVDVAARQLRQDDGTVVSFELDARRQASLLAGADEISGTLQHQDAIDAFRSRHRARAPWLYSPTLPQAPS